MLTIMDTVLDATQTAELRDLLAQVDFEDGRASAGWAAGLVKQNRQASADPAVEMWRERIAGVLATHALIAIAAMPKRIIGPIFSRYCPGDAYGTHVDEPVMLLSRVDISFTLFLSDPAAYDGGELVIETPAGEDHHKYSAGSLVLYPATTLHRVAPVSRGERLAAVGWIRSLVRNPEQRELLFDLETARRRLFETSGKTPEVDLLSKCHANLMRMWIDD